MRNPIYVAALPIVLGEAWLFMSLWLLAYAGTMAVFFHLFVTGYEERALRRRFWQQAMGAPAHGLALDPPPAAPRLNVVPGDKVTQVQ